MDVMLVFNVVVALFGAYMIWSALQMKKSGKINSMVLAQEELKKVKDTKGFIEFLYWREMLFGALVLIVGVLGVLNETVMPIGKASILEVIIFLAAFIWFQNSLAKAREKFLHFMQGRYGADQLYRVMLIGGAVLVILSNFIFEVFFLLLGWILVVLAFVRAFSKDYSRRYAENQKFLELTGKIRKVFGKQRYVMEQRKDYHIYTCPQCRQKIRMPRGKGKVEISCPKCHTKFIKKS